ncbi:MAG: putative LuxR-family transcriptional regulator [Actinomycetia bacterium]|nr:putative LuxR-family transcriptional regulator [Actinomycetes bacterium]
MPGRFVGRRQELAVARAALDATAAGHGCVLVLAGEAGIGKSRLAREVTALARDRDMAVVWAAGWPGGGAPAYWPWQEVLVTIDAEAAAALDSSGTGADTERFHRFRAVSQALWQASARRPLVIVLDDAHSMDGDGLLLTRFVARAVATRPVLLVVTHRSTADVPTATITALTEIAREATVCPLEGFDGRDLAELMAALGELPADAVVDRVQELTDGNPFLVEQALQADLHDGDVAMPDGARTLLDTKLALLDPTTRVVLEAAAVLGPPATAAEIALVSECDGATLADARRRAIATGLLRADAGNRFSFTHDLAREAVLTQLSPARRAALHRASLSALEPRSSAEVALRRARHALALAALSTDDARDAVATARASAALLMSHGSPERAVDLLCDALEAHDTARLGDVAPVLVELGRALLGTGRLSDARHRFAEATAAAERAADPITYAEAVLGLGGLQVREQRDPEESRNYVNTVARAIARLTHDPSGRALRLVAALRLRLAVERGALGDASIDEIRTAFEGVREVGAPHDLSAGLSLLHQVMLGPIFAEERVEVTAELLDVARSCGDEVNLLMGLLWHAVDDLLLGRDADRALAAVRARADALGMAVTIYVLDAIDVMRLMRAGEMKDASAAAEACLQRGLEVGDPDATTYYAAHALGLAWYAGEALELLEVAQQFAASSQMPDENPVFVSVVAALAAESGDVDLAARSIAQLEPLDNVLPTSSWLTTMFALVEAVRFLADAALAERLYANLLPYADLPVLGSLGVCCFGSTHRSLGIAARVAGRLDDAVGHLEDAVAANQRLGNRPLTAITRGDLAGTLLERDAPGDRERAVGLLDNALDAARRMNLHGRVASLVRAREVAEQAAPTAPAESSSATCVRHGEEWEIAALGEGARVADSVGMRYVAALLASPGIDVSAGQLAGVELTSASYDVLDAAALRALRQRMVDLEDGIDRAALRDDKDAVQRLQDELDALIAHARAASGRGGRSRRFDDANERARTAVQKAIRRAIESIGRDAPQLADALRASIRTGYECKYDAREGAPERWRVQTESDERSP